MKKFLIVLMLVAFLAPSAFALECTQAQSPGQPSQCWELVTVSSAETTLVSRGSVLVLDTNATSSLQGVQRAKVSSASGDTAVGVAQQSIASGESALVLVRGFGKVKTNGGNGTGAVLYSAATGGTGIVGSGKIVGTTLTTTTAGTQTQDAYITIV